MEAVREDNCTAVSQKYAHPPFLLQVIAKGPLLLKSMPTQQTKIICSSMHNHETCSVTMCELIMLRVCVITSCILASAAEEDAVGEQQLKRMQSGSSS